MLRLNFVKPSRLSPPGEYLLWLYRLPFGGLMCCGHAVTRVAVGMGLLFLLLLLLLLLLDTDAARLNFQTVATCRARAVKHVLRSVARGTVVVRSGGMDGALDAWRTRRRGVGLRAAPCRGTL